MREVAAMQLLMQQNVSITTKEDQHDKEASQYVIPLLDVCQDSKYVFIVLPYYSNGDLFNYMETREGKGLPEEEARSYLHQMTLGLHAL